MRLFVTLVLFTGLSVSCTKKNVSDDTIRNQKQLTETSELKNKIPVVMRRVDESPVVAINIYFSSGVGAAGFGKERLAKRVMWNMMGVASKNYSKEKVNELTEKYLVTMSCTESLERSTCGVMAVDDYLKEALPVFIDLVLNPVFNKEDFDTTKARLNAKLQSIPTDPAGQVNEVVNRVFYPKDHPFSPDHKQELAWLEQVTLEDVKVQHQKFMDAALMTLVVVGGKDQNAIKSELDKAFSGIKRSDYEAVDLPEPKFDPKNNFAFAHRDIPTAYLRFKFNAPSARDPDFAGSQLMFTIFSKLLAETVRTKLSLSYAVYSYTLQLSMGFGIMEAWTSKPQETLAAIKQVIEELKSKELSKTELDEYKTESATNYFLDLETNASIGAGLADSQFYLHDPLRFYDFPREMEKVRPQDIKRLANKILKDFRLGVVYHQDKFKQEWFAM